MELNLITVLSFVVLFTYSFQAVNFAGQILSKTKMILKVQLALTLLNFVFLAVVFYSNLSFYLMYIILFLGILLEIKFLSDTKIGQGVFGTLVFMLNISHVHLLTIIIVSNLTKKPTIDFYVDTSFKALTVLFAFGILSLVLIIFKNFIPLQTVIRLSKRFPYSAIISITALAMFINTLADSFFLITSNSNMSLTITIVFNVLFSYVVFYFVFLFSVNLINLHAYKRKADEVENTYNQVMQEKVRVNKKIYTDTLTGVFNRKYLDEKMDLLLQDAKAEFVVVFLDITGLKYVNDTYGHQAGDTYIKVVANILKQSVRDFDTVARVGGDEFVLIAEYLSEEKTDVLLDRIKTNVLCENKKHEFLVNVSIGSVYVNNQNNKYEKALIFDKADERMRADKKLFYSEMENKK